MSERQVFMAKEQVLGERSRHLGLRVAVSSLGALAMIAVPAQSADAAILTVPCSAAALVSAINTANASGPSTINLAPGCTYALDGVSPAPVDVGNGPNGLPPISGTLTINGQRATIARSTAGGTPNFRLLEVAAGATLSAQQLTVTNGRDASGSGAGGILNGGTLSLTSSKVTGNTATTADSADALGGGILSLGTLTLTSSQVTDNAARATGDGGAFGGGLRNGSFSGQGGPLTIRSTVFSGNVASATGSQEFSRSVGGGISNVQAAATIDNSDVRGNTASVGGSQAAAQGGGIATRDQLTLRGTAVRNNVVSGGFAFGGGIVHGGGLTMTGSAVSGNAVRTTGSGGLALGGGILNAGATASLNSSEVSGNSATAPGGLALGGGILNDFGTMSLNGSVVSRNTASAPAGTQDGGGIFNESGSVSLGSTLVSGNAPNNCRPPDSVPGCTG